MTRELLPGRSTVSAEPQHRLATGRDVVGCHHRQAVHLAADASRIAHFNEADDLGPGRARPVSDLSREAARPCDVKLPLNSQDRRQA